MPVSEQNLQFRYRFYRHSQGPDMVSHIRARINHGDALGTYQVGPRPI